MGEYYEGWKLYLLNADKKEFKSYIATNENMDMLFLSKIWLKSAKLREFGL